MKKTISLILVLFISFILLVGCNINNPNNNEHAHISEGKWQTNNTYHWLDCTCGEEVLKAEHSYVDGKCSTCNFSDPDYKTPNLELAIELEKIELNKIKESILNNVDDSLMSNISALFDKAFIDLNKASTITDLNAISDGYLNNVYDLIPLANGEFDFSTINHTEKEKILSLLDEYIFRNNLGGIPISQYRTLNLNSTTKEKWDEFFGVEGSKCQTAKDQYWDVKPFLSNEYFLKGLSLSLPKSEEPVESTEYLRIDYSKYKFYNYDVELAKKYFSLAAEDLFLDYATSSQFPIELKLEIAFGVYNDSNEKLFNTLKNNIEIAFNNESVSNGYFQLTVEAWYGKYLGQIYTEKLYNGQFDLSFAKISGSSYDQYMNYTLLSSNLDLSNNLTINWSIDTNNIEDDCIVYNGYRYTYDALLSLLSSKNTIINGTLKSNSN